MLSKALFKQSWKANRLMWSIITFADCFMLACVMLITGGGNIVEVKDAVQDTIIRGEIDASMESRSITYYKLSFDGMQNFDGYFVSECLKTGASTSSDIEAAYMAAVNSLIAYVNSNAQENGYTQQAEEMLGAIMCALNPGGQLDSIYYDNGENIPDSYDINSLLFHIQSGDISEYTQSSERLRYIGDRAENSSAVFLANNMIKTENVGLLLEKLSKYGVTEQKYQTFGYIYSSVKSKAFTTVVSYRARYEHELSVINEKYKSGEYSNESEYSAAVEEMENSLSKDLTESLLASLPSEVSDALEEIGQMDIFSLVIANMYYKMAGLLLPIIYLIMAANNLIAGQVDSGSMAYVLSSSTKREQVTFTQAVYLIGSLLSMCCFMTVTSMVCFKIIGLDNLKLNYLKLLYLNAGAFFVLFAMSGICYFTSCLFDRSKYSLSVGGGLCMFFLVAVMLGLFGTHIIPSVIRLDALNVFNYVSIISLFDIFSIIDGTAAFVWKFAVLAAIGIVGYVSGAEIFKRKDLPL